MVEVKETVARPFLKWAGGKGRLITQLRQHFPSDFVNYFEPFLGGGAVFFNLPITGKVYLNDINTSLINSYVHVKDDVDNLITCLSVLEKKYKKLSEDDRQVFYYEQREKFNSLPKGIQKSVLLIFLNKTCFNGLYRENSKGMFNVPFGRFSNPTICDADNLRAASVLLKDTSLTSTPYSKVVKHAKRGDFVYLDPPYHPTNVSSSFTAYSKDGFTAQDQEELHDLFVELDRRGCFVMLSNSNTPLIRDLYRCFTQESISAARAINAQGAKRGKISELIVLNY